MNMFEYLLANDKDKSAMAKAELERFILERFNNGNFNNGTFYIDKQSADYILALLDLI